MRTRKSTLSSKKKSSRTRAGLRRSDTVHEYANHPETKAPKTRGSQKKAEPRKKLPKTYQRLIVEAIKSLNSPTGSSAISIERYIESTYAGTKVSRPHLHSAIENSIICNLISRVSRHHNSFKIKENTPVSSSRPSHPKQRTTRNSTNATRTALTPNLVVANDNNNNNNSTSSSSSTSRGGRRNVRRNAPNAVNNNTSSSSTSASSSSSSQIVTNFVVPPPLGPVISKKWEFSLNARAFGIFVSSDKVYAADETGLVCELSHDGDLKSLFKIEDGVKCLVNDSGFLFLGCNNGSVYDLTSGSPRLVAKLEDFAQIYWIDMCIGRTVVSDGNGNIALVNSEGETEWKKKSSGEDGWMVRVDPDGIYHGHSNGVTKYDHKGNVVWHTETHPVLFGWQEKDYVYASLVEAGCFDGEIAKRLKRAGAKSGEVVISLMWNTTDDLDLHVICPSGEEIYFCHKQSACGGELDVDMNTFCSMSKEPVENIYWTNAPVGHYKVNVVRFSKREGEETPFEVHIKNRDQVSKFNSVIKTERTTLLVHEFDVTLPGATTTSSSSNSTTKEKPQKSVVKISKETGEIKTIFNAGLSVPSVTCSENGSHVFAGVPQSIKCFNEDANELWQLWTGVGNVMSMQYFGSLLFAVCNNKLICMDVSDEAIDKAKKGNAEIGRILQRDDSIIQTPEEIEMADGTETGVITVVCVKEGSKIRVRPKSGQGYDSDKNVQFPKNIRSDGAEFLVDKLVSCGAFYRVEGAIKRKN